MAKDTFYFSHDYNVRTDEKIKLIIRKHGMLGYGIFWAIIEDLYNNSNELMCDYDGIAYDLRTEKDIVKSIINDFDLFIIDGDKFGSCSVERRILDRKAKSVKASESASSKWLNSRERSKLNATTRSERLSIARSKGTHTSEEWESMKSYFGQCVRCGSTDSLVKDHIIPIYQGGSDEISNLQPLCKRCNSSKGSEDIDHRLIYCSKNACEMPANYLKMPSNDTKTSAIKERKGKEIKVKERTYIEEEFRDSFMEFLDYKKERKEGYKTEKSEILAYNNLKQLAGNSPKNAKLIVEQCMANNWAGLFALRVDTGKSSNPTSTPKSTINNEYDIVYDYIIKNLPRCKMSTSPLDRREFNSLKISAEQAKIFLHIIEKMDRIGSVYSEMEKMVWEQRYIASKQLNK